jgi:HSP20 family protein
MAKAKEQQIAQQNNEQSLQQTGEQKQELTRREQYTPSLWTNPFSFMRRFSEEMDRIFEDFGFGRSLIGSRLSSDLLPSTWGSGQAFQTLWNPEVEVFEKDGQLIVRADLPGINKDDVKVEVTDNAITIQGERKSEHEEKKQGYYRSERSYGSFYRSIPLPEGVNSEEANATFRNGVLEITMKAPERKPRGRQLEIKEESTNK